jgi:glycosyltransferase involved in cell wall biosynthesis
MKASFITGKHDVQRMNAMGLQNVYWMPEGHSEKIHTFENESVKEREGVSFIGQVDNVIRDAGGLTREDYVKILKLHYGDDFAVYTGMYGDSYRKCISKHRITVDLPIAHNIGTRIFEASAMGVPIIRTRNDSPGLDEFFVDRINMIEFTPGNISEMLDKIDTVLALSPIMYRSICEQIVCYSSRQGYINRLSYAMENIGYV